MYVCVAYSILNTHITSSLTQSRTYPGFEEGDLAHYIRTLSMIRGPRLYISRSSLLFTRLRSTIYVSRSCFVLKTMATMNKTDTTAKLAKLRGLMKQRNVDVYGTFITKHEIRHLSRVSRLNIEQLYHRRIAIPLNISLIAIPGEATSQVSPVLRVAL